MVVLAVAAGLFLRSRADRTGAPAPPRASDRAGTIPAPAASPAPLRVALRRAVTLTVRGLGPDGGLLPGAEIAVFDEAGLEVSLYAEDSAFADDGSGRAAFRLAPGAYTVYVDAEGYRTLEETVQLPPAGAEVALRPEPR